MKKLQRKLAGLAVATMVSTTAFAAPGDCGTFASSATMFNACIGLDNIATTTVAGANAAFATDLLYTTENKDDNPAAGTQGTNVFDVVMGAGNSLTLTFLQAVGDGTGTAVIGLKFGGANDGNKLGYFLFNNADFDIGEVLTFTWNQEFQGDGISHASVFGSVAAIPEPETYALMLAGLGAVGFMARRRRQA